MDVAAVKAVQGLRGETSTGSWGMWPARCGRTRDVLRARSSSIARFLSRRGPWDGVSPSFLCSARSVASQHPGVRASGLPVPEGFPTLTPESSASTGRMEGA